MGRKNSNRSQRQWISGETIGDERTVNQDSLRSQMTAFVVAGGTNLPRRCPRAMREIGRSVYRAVHGDGRHLAPSGSFLKCVLVTKVCCRYWGSSTMVVMIR